MLELSDFVFAIFALSLVTICAMTIVAALTLVRSKEDERATDEGIKTISGIFSGFLGILKNIISPGGNRE